MDIMKTYFKHTALLILMTFILSCSSPNPVTNLNEAQSAAAKGNWSEAENKLEKVLNASSKYPEILILYALCISQKEDHKSALNYFQKAQKYLPQKTILLWFIANEYYKLGDFKNARTYFISYYDETSEDFEALKMIVNCETKLTRLKKSQYLIKLAKYLQKNNLKSEAYNLRGIQEAKSGNLRKSFIYFKRAEAQSKNTASVFLNLAIIYDKKGATIHAVRYYKKYLEAVNSLSPANVVDVRKRLKELQ